MPETFEDLATLDHAIVEEAPDAIIYVDRDGLIRIWNARAAAIFGYAAEEVLGGSLDVIIPESLRAAHWEGFRRAVDTGQAKYNGRVLTTRSMRKDGSKIYVDLSFALLKDADGVVRGSLAIARDVTETYQATRALKARVAELESKLRSADDTTLKSS